MSKRRGGRGSKYTDECKRRLVAESHGDGVSVPMVSRRHGVPTNRIYAWRGDARFQPAASDDAEVHASRDFWRRSRCGGCAARSAANEHSDILSSD